MAAVLAGAWRDVPPAPELSPQELSDITPGLLGSGAGALGWWRVRHSDLKTSPAASSLQQAYRLHTLQAAIHEREIAEVFTLLHAAGVEPVLVKGWAVARLYPQKGLRPYGDLDLCVRSGEYAAAEAVLQSPAGKQFNIDLHAEFAKLDDHGLEELYARSRLVQLGGVDVRILGVEDHLRLLCVHFLRHGAWRPLWLCDVAVTLESRPPSFDWDLCLGRNRRRADWVACVIGLAHQLLGVSIDDTPVAARARHLPAWLLPCVLKTWDKPCAIDHLPPKKFAIAVRHPAQLPNALRVRWPPNPIAATIDLQGPLNAMPRLSFQIAHCLARLIRFCRRELMHNPQDRSPPVG
ncbi:MAG TPA: nucleotidyltransferase family protein [Alphaproteobacteria bacterium]|nr:nucleotidyltransferase family protein [Alphaproteobacteria bacterium]